MPLSHVWTQLQTLCPHPPPTHTSHTFPPPPLKPSPLFLPAPPTLCPVRLSTDYGNTFTARQTPTKWKGSGIKSIKMHPYKDWLMVLVKRPDCKSLDHVQIECPHDLMLSTVSSGCSSSSSSSWPQQQQQKHQLQEPPPQKQQQRPPQQQQQLPTAFACLV